MWFRSLNEFRRTNLATNLGDLTLFGWAWEGYGIPYKFINQCKEHTLRHTEKSALPLPPETKGLWASKELHYFHSDLFVIQLSFQFTCSLPPLKQLPVFLKIIWCQPAMKALKTAAVLLSAGTSAFLWGPPFKNSVGTPSESLKNFTC